MIIVRIVIVMIIITLVIIIAVRIIIFMIRIVIIIIAILVMGGKYSFRGLGAWSLRFRGLGCTVQGVRIVESRARL